MRSLDDILDSKSVENRLQQIAYQDKKTITNEDREVLIEAVSELMRLREIASSHIRAAGAWSSVHAIERNPAQRIPLQIGPRFGVTAHIRASIIRDAPGLARELIAETAGNQFVRCIQSLGEAGLEPYLVAEAEAEAEAEERERKAGTDATA